jgi:hypothetical protein
MFLDFAKELIMKCDFNKMLQLHILRTHISWQMASRRTIRYQGFVILFQITMATECFKKKDSR